MRIRRVAATLDISPDWIRDLERAGLIPPVPRDLNGHRRFRAKDVEHIRHVVFGQEGVVRGGREKRI